MKIRLCVIALALSLSLTTTVLAQQRYPLDASSWVINPDSGSVAYPFDGETGTACFNFPRSPVSDPNDIGPWYGYFVQAWTGSITGSQLSITYKIKEAQTGTIFNWMSESDNTCSPVGSPAYCHLYFQSGDLYNGDGYNRWWSNPQAVQLAAGRVTLTVSFDPSQWSETFGRSGTSNPPAFYTTLANPSYIGVTFGGGCFFSHGVNTTYGKAQFQLLDLSSY
jgi:hypothetical protein